MNKLVIKEMKSFHYLKHLKLETHEFPISYKYLIAESLLHLKIN